MKYGEDLQQDDRIQQIQELMSDQMKTDRNCSQHKLSLRTYKVMPLNIHCGLISWIENTETIDGLLSNKNWNHLNEKARREFKAFLSKGQEKTEKKVSANVAAAIYYSPEEVSMIIISKT